MTLPTVSTEILIKHGLAQTEAASLSETLNTLFQTHTAEQAWQTISKTLLKTTHPFSLHLFLYTTCYPKWYTQADTAPAIFPNETDIQNSHLYQWMSELSCKTLAEFHTWSVTHFERFWQSLIQKLTIVFKKNPSAVCNLSLGVKHPIWLPDAEMNITDSCFTANPEIPALVFPDKHGHTQTLSYAALNTLTNRIANSLVEHNFNAGDAIAISMPMTVEAVAIYLGILKMGGVVVSIADSFSSEEIAIRLRITHAKAIFTQHSVTRLGKTLTLYTKICAANPERIIVLNDTTTEHQSKLRSTDLSWEDFLSDNTRFISHPNSAMAPCNILFSSGTTGEPKAIAWNTCTAIKAAGDAYLYHNIQTNDVIAWPTNLGWMMGPWLIFAALINRATLAIYPDAATNKNFGQFIQDAKVTILGVIPSLVSNWRHTECMQGLNWSAIKAFSSTGECSNAEDMLYLMSLAQYKPVIEYCGGTEIGGAYITSTLIEKNYPSLLTTPVMGMDCLLLNEQGQICNHGDVALSVPAMGLSTELLNADHEAIYFANMPSPQGRILRRHGDQLCRTPQGLYSILGRSDDTMNLGGIKISSAEIERCISQTPGVLETAAIAVTPKKHGPSQLILYVVRKNTSLTKEDVMPHLQTQIQQHLNPLFKIYDIVFIDQLPKTATQKILRRRLREIYQKDAKLT